jgi:hypothetical protein
MSREDYLFREWLRARRIRDKSAGPKFEAYLYLADALQYALQDYSVGGWRRVWGSEWAKERAA